MYTLLKLLPPYSVTIALITMSNATVSEIIMSAAPFFNCKLLMSRIRGSNSRAAAQYVKKYAAPYIITTNALPICTLPLPFTNVTNVANGFDPTAVGAEAPDNPIAVTAISKSSNAICCTA